MRLWWLRARRDDERPARMRSALVLATLGDMLTEAESVRSRAVGPELQIADARVAALRDARDRLGALAVAAAGDEGGQADRRR